MRSAPLILLLFAAPAAAQEGGAAVYRKAVPSVAWIHSARPNGLATGSGALIDRTRRLVLTNYHVVEENPRATVFFPAFRDGLPVPEKEYYTDRAARLGVPARVVALAKTADLALLQLESAPADAPGIPLAGQSPDPGSNVQSIGNAGKSGALWGFVRGTVRQVYQKTWRAELGSKRVATFSARVIETDSPTNPGDSGGPLLNDKGELVGVVQGGALEANSVSTFVDLSEVKKLLASKGALDVARTPTPAPPPTPAVPARRTAPAPVVDGAKLLSPDGVAAANKAVEELFHKRLDVLVETHAAAPEAWREKGRKATPEERGKLFAEWAEERLRQQNARGVMILVCQDPRYVAVEVEREVKGRFPDGFAKATGAALVEAFKQKNYDDGIKDALAKIAGAAEPEAP